VQGELEPVYRAALSLGTANQLTNILRDVGEDIRDRNRIYVPLDTLQQFDINEADVVGGMHSTSNGKMDDRWVLFMQHMVCVALSIVFAPDALQCDSMPASDSQHEPVVLAHSPLLQLHGTDITFALLTHTRMQIDKTRAYYSAAEDGINGLDPKAKWPVWAALIVYRKILDAIERNAYDNITKRAYVSKPRKIALLPFAWACAHWPKQASRISELV
jgi:phytoene/squalene synthetase